MAALIAVSLVTYNSREEIPRCLDCLFHQTLQDFCVKVWDNGSTDGTVEFLKTLSLPQVSVELSGENVGFCAAHNHLIGESDTAYVLVLNPDCYLEANYLEEVFSAIQRDERIGAVAGKLYRIDHPLERFDKARRRALLDSTGIYFTPALRHFDRGSNEVEAGRFQRSEWVFGVTGAAAFYRREALEHVRLGHEFFDEDFFAYREDADLAWRMQSAGWKCLFTPRAIGYHVRKVLPTDRASTQALLNMHSVKNRFLFRLNNVSAWTCLRFLIPMLTRDAAVIGYVLLVEHGSIRGLRHVLKHFSARWRRRRQLQRARLVPLSYLHQWIRWRPVSFPVDEK